MSTYSSAAPKTVMLGIQDKSTRPKAVERAQVPTHLPKIYIYAKKGPLTPQLIAAESRASMYGAETFDPTYPWCNHQTVFSNAIGAKGNAQMIERLIPADAGPKANMTLWLDVLAVQVPIYQRGTDGAYILDAITGLPKQVTGTTTTTAGFKCKWVVDHITTGNATDADSDLFAKQASKSGDQTDGAATSTRYPILQWWAASPGEYANNAGFRLWAPTVNSTSPVNQKLLGKIKAFPFRMAAINRVDSASTPTISQMLSGDAALEFVVKENTKNPYTDAQVSLGDLFGSAWQSIGQAGFDNVYADLGNLHIYQNNIETLLAQFYAAEQAYVTADVAAGIGSDFTSGQTDGKYAFNFLSGQSSSAVPYHTFVINSTDNDAVVLSESTNLFAGGGSDGTMSNANFASLVKTAVLRYADKNDPLQDEAKWPESIIYDSGFPLATKKALCSFIAVRKDTFVALSTYDVDGPELTHSDEAALGLSLHSQLNLYPESSYFGTPVVRGLVMGRYGKMLGTTYKGKLPLLAEIAAKSAAFMGAGNGVWNPSYLFDMGEKNVIELFDASTLNVNFTPAQQRNVDWANGLNYPVSYSHDQMYLPALKTAYSDDTSVLTNFFTAMACVELQKIGLAAHRKFTGVVSLTEDQLIEQVNKFVNESVSGKFAGLVKVVPNCTITDGDRQRGYSWTLPINIYANNSKTVMTLSVVANRMSDLTSST